ncbi:MAG: PspA/IM30 family protein [Solirubrobacteraceae bacterium]
MFKRFRFSLKAKLSRLLDRAEDPAEILDYSYAQQVEQLHALSRDVADLVTAKKRVAHVRDHRREQFLRLGSHARRALELGREDLAREALERRRLVGLELFDLDRQVSELEDQQARLVARGREYRSSVQRFRSRKEVAKAQYTAAKAQLAISDAAAGLSSQLRDVGLRTRRTMDKVEDMNVRADVMRELEEAGTLDPIGTGADDIDRQLRRLYAGTSVDAEIARIKRDLDT